MSFAAKLENAIISLEYTIFVLFKPDLMLGVPFFLLVILWF